MPEAQRAYKIIRADAGRGVAETVAIFKGDNPPELIAISPEGDIFVEHISNDDNPVGNKQFYVIKSVYREN